MSKFSGRYKRVMITPELLVTMCKPGSPFPPSKCTRGLPDDTRLVSVVVEGGITYETIALIVASSEFEEVGYATCMALPEARVEFENA